MYDVKAGKWKSDCTSDVLLRWSAEPANAEQPQARFLRASDLLEKNRKGGDLAQAVELMELAAKQKYGPAVFAMGQMCYWGWGIHKDRKLALEWYRKAADLEYEPAKQELERLKRRRIINIASVSAALVAVVCVAAFALNAFLANMRIIRVHKDTQLVETTTVDEFGQELSTLITQYDSELVISGQVSTNRLMLQLEGNRLDLSDFMADKVVAREDDFIIIQFATEEEARRCLEELSKRTDIVYVEMDQYVEAIDEVRAEDCTLDVVRSTNDGPNHNSWGILDMGLDQLRDYVIQTYPNNSVKVGVIDTGLSTYVQNLPEVVKCYNMVTGGASSPHSHGSHVTGVIWEATRGTNVQITSYDVMNAKSEDDRSTSELLIINAIDKCIEDGMQVVNMSIGSQMHSNAKVAAVRRMVDAGILFVNSAGNESFNLDIDHNCPAEVEGIIAVAAYDINHDPADFTNYGSCVDVSAPGVDILSFGRDPSGKLVWKNGTSMAAPHVAGLAALVRLMYPDASTDDVILYIQDYCRTFRNPDMYATGYFGAGAPDATKFIESNPD